MGLPSSDTAAINVIDANVDTIDGLVDTLTINLSNLAPAYGKVSVYPNLAAGTAVAAVNGAGSYTLGDATGTIFTASNNTIVGVQIETISAAGHYQLNIYAAGTICGSVVFSRVEVAVVDSVYIPFRSQQVTGAITCKLATVDDAGETCAVKLLVV